MMNGNDMHESVAAYLLGALPPQDASAFERHLRDCRRCIDEYRTLRPIADALAMAPLPSPSVSPLVKARILREIRTDRKPSRAFAAYVLAAACLAIAIIFSGAYAYRSGENARLQAQLNRTNGVLADMLSRNARRYTVPGGQIVRNGAHVYVVMHTLAQPPRGTVYQMWTLGAGAKTVAPSVTFVPTRGETLLQLPVDASHLVAVAMSVEPPGGSKQPTTKPKFLVKL